MVRFTARRFDEQEPLSRASSLRIGTKTSPSLLRTGLGLLTAIALALLMTITAPSAHASISRIDGMSDQHMSDAGGPWQHPLANNTGDGRTLDSVFRNVWVASGRIKYARLVTSWNAGPAGGACLDAVKRFYVYAASLSLTPVLSLTNQGLGPCAATPAPTLASTYATSLTTLMNALHATSAGTVPVVIQAFNEPNLTLTTGNGTGPDYAVTIWGKANTVCATQSCTALAGGFTDSRNSQAAGCASTNFSNVASYEQQYVDSFATHGYALPSNWAYHPYNTVLCHGSFDASHPDPLETFKNKVAWTLPSIWLTEAGVYVCQPSSGTRQSLAQQDADASYLNGVLGRWYVAHAFYYSMAWNYTGPLNANKACTNGSSQQDSLLYADNNDNGVNDGYYYARPAARTLYGPSSPGAFTGTVGYLGSGYVIMTGNVNQGGVTDAWYHFDYGLTASYGTITPDVPIGSGVTDFAVGSQVTNLKPGAIYHYRVVTFNGIDAPAFGADRTFVAPDRASDVVNLETDPNHAGRYRWLDFPNNNGVFGTPNVLFDNLIAPIQSARLDVDQDGRTDLAELEPDPAHAGRYRWLWLKGTASGVYTVGGVLFDNLLAPTAARVIDIDGDGKATDIAEFEPDPAHAGRYRWLWLKGNSNGIYTVGGVLFDNLLPVTRTLVADIDHDGRTDIAEMEADPAHPGMYRWLWLKSNPSGVFTVGGVFFDNLLDAKQALSLDIDRDGMFDVAELEADPAHPGKYRWLWLKGTLSGSTYPVGGVLFDNLNLPTQAVAMDVNGDGYTDVAELEADPASSGHYRWLWLKGTTSGIYTVGGVIWANLNTAIQALTLPPR